jgi:hypothetical protein
VLSTPELVFEENSFAFAFAAIEPQSVIPSQYPVMESV